MAESTVIREFLVALGFKLDESAMKKFTGGVTSATKAVFKLGTVIEATALAVAVGVAKFASNLEALYFAAQRTNSSASGLKAFDLAARNFGASIDEAQGSVEALSSFLRNNPGGENFLEGWLHGVGESARDANGHLKSGVDLMGSLGKLFQSQRANGQTYLASQIAGQLGISERTMLAISTPGYQEELSRQQKQVHGWDSVTKAAHRFMIQLEDLKMQVLGLLLSLQGPLQSQLGLSLGSISKFLSANGPAITKDIVSALKYLFQEFNHLLDWLNANGPLIRQRIHETFGEVQTVYGIVRPAMDWLLDEFIKLDKATDGWSTKILAAAAALKLMGATGIVTGITGLGVALAKAFGKSLSVAATASEGEGVWAAAGLAWGLSAATAIGVGLGALFDHYFPNNWLAQGGSWLGGKAADVGDLINNRIDDMNLQKLYSRLHNTNAVPAFLSHDALDADRAKGKTFQQETKIIIQGALHSDPATIARAVALEQSRVNAEIIREFSPDSR